jgi:hypothetical protein
MTKSITQKGAKNLVRNLKNYRLSCTAQIKYFSCLLILFFSSIGWGQNASQYAFSQSNGTYTPLVSPTVLGSGSTLDNATYSIAAGSLSGFSFNFAGTNYTAFTVSPNGFIGLGSSLMAGTTYTPLSSSSGGNVFIAAYGDDLGGLDANTQISWKLEGTTPNRELVVEYRNMRNYGRADVNLTFQIRLVETANVVKIVYGTMTYTSATQDISQVGIKSSATSSHFSNRSTTTNWNSTNTGSSNSSTCRVLNTVTMPTSGLTFTWTPPTPCSGTPTAGTISTANQYLCSGATVPNLVNTGFSSGVTGITFQWQQSTDDATWSNVTTGTGATTAIYTPPVFAGTTIYYRCNVTCANGGGAAATPSVSINPPANPATQVSSLTFSSVSYTGFTASWTNGNGNRRVVYVSDTAITDPTNNSGAAALTASTTYSGTGQKIVYDGTGTSVSVTGLALGTTYNVKVIEYTQCGSGTFDNYFNVTSGTNSSSVSTTAVTAVPWNEGFATTTLPSGWLNPSSLTIASNVSSLNPALATNYMYVNLYDYYDWWDDTNYSNTTANFSTPIFAALPANYRLVFDYKINDYGESTAPSAGTGNIVVAISTNNGSTFTTLRTINNNGITGWQNVVIDLSAYSGQNIRLKFTANESTTEIDYYVGFDNFKIEEIPAPTITNVTSSVACGQTSSVLTITGAGLTNATSVKVGGTTITPLTINTDTQITATLSSAVSGTVEVITNAGSVTSSGTVSFAISPALSLNSNTQTNCASVTNSAVTTLTSTVADYDTYTWSPSTNVSGDATNGWTFNPTATTTYTLTASNSAGCSSTATKIITVNPLPSAVSVSPGTTVIAPNSITTLIASGGNISNAPVFSETFNSGIGTFTTVNNSSSTNQNWTPRSNGYAYSSSTFSGSISGFMMANSDIGGSGSTANSQLISPSFSTVGYTNLTLNFIEFLNNPNDTAAAIEISDDNFTSSITILRNQIATDIGSASTFSNTSLSIPSSFENKNNVKIRFRYVAAYDWYWAVDEVSIKGNQSTTITWSPTTDLYTDAGATVAYTGGAATTVYAKPTATTTYSATSTSTTGCTSNGSTTLKIGNTWTGTTSNSWNTASNWSLNTVPSSSDDVLISSNGSNAPVMDVDVTIPAGKSLTITGGTLTIAPGKVLTIAGTANFGGRPVTFKSNATGTAMLGIITGTLTGATSVTVERFIPAGKRAFRLLSPAVTTTGFISGNWQEQTHITGGASGGFDATETNNPSMYTYNNQAAQGVSGWTPILNTNATNLTAGVGYRMLVRGDRTSTNITTATTDNMNAAITLIATGTLKTGTVALNASSTPSINNITNTVTNGFSLVGNPYQSSVDWNAVTKSGIDASYYAWDPNMGTTAQRGRYVSFNGTTNSVIDGAGSPVSNVGQFIQPGQAFFVKNTTSGTAGTLTFQEAHKATTNANVFRTANTPSLGVALYDPNELAIGGYPIDATKAVFSSDYSNELGLGDATKLEAAGENIAWFRNNTKLAIDAAAPVTTSDELVMKTIRLGANKNYTFKIQTTNFDSALTPYLVDTFLNTQTEISTSQAHLASFATTSNVASYSENRFKVVFQNAVLSTDTFASQVGLYPNPSKGNGFYLQLPSSEQATVKLYNTLGQEIAISHNEGHYQANQSLAAGVYHIMVTQGEKTSKLKWIVE